MSARNASAVSRRWNTARGAGFVVRRDSDLGIEVRISRLRVLEIEQGLSSLGEGLHFFPVFPNRLEDARKDERHGKDDLDEEQRSRNENLQIRHASSIVISIRLARIEKRPYTSMGR